MPAETFRGTGTITRISDDTVVGEERLYELDLTPAHAAIDAGGRWEGVPKLTGRVELLSGDESHAFFGQHFLLTMEGGLSVEFEFRHFDGQWGIIIPTSSLKRGGRGAGV